MCPSSQDLIVENHQKMKPLIQTAIQVLHSIVMLMAVKRVFSNNSEPDRSPLKSRTTTLPRVKGRTLQAGRTGRNITRGASVNKRGKK